tara:strand:- start:1471 stop:1968 length:498 start_codon:yes stop_codon:yes gene_type:complete
MAATAETDLTFTTVDGAVFDPLKIKSEFLAPDSIEVTVTNMNVDQSLVDLGIYIRPSANLGPWDNPAEQPPATDYQDLLMWGTRSEDDPNFEGGIKITSPAVGGDEVWVTRSAGGYYTNRIPIANLAPSGQLTFKIEFVTPSEDDGSGWKSILDARRLFVAVVVA